MERQHRGNRDGGAAVESLEDRRVLAVAGQVIAEDYTLFTYQRQLDVSLGGWRSYRSELWRTDGTPSGTQMLGVLPQDASEVGKFNYGRHVATRINGRDVFSDRSYRSSSGASGEQLWTTDGTLAGTRPVFAGADVGPISLGFYPSRPWRAFDGVFYGLATTKPGRTNGAWRSDGTQSGTAQLQFSLGVNDVVGVGANAYTLRIVPDSTIGDGGFRAEVARYVNGTGGPIRFDVLRLTNPVGVMPDATSVRLGVLGGRLVLNSYGRLYSVDGTPAQAEIAPGSRFNLEQTINAPAAFGTVIEDGADAFSDGTAPGSWRLPASTDGQPRWGRGLAFDDRSVYSLSQGLQLTITQRANPSSVTRERAPRFVPANATLLNAELAVVKGQLYLTETWWDGTQDQSRVKRRVGANQWVDASAGAVDRIAGAGDVKAPDLGTISATPFADLNGNAQRDANEPLLCGTLKVRSLTQPELTGSSEYQASGVATLEGVQAGRYAIEFAATYGNGVFVDSLRPALMTPIVRQLRGGQALHLEIPVKIAPVGTSSIRADVFFDLIRDGRPDSPLRGTTRNDGSFEPDWRYRLPEGKVAIDVQRYEGGKRVGQLTLSTSLWTWDSQLNYAEIGGLPAGRYFVKLNLTGFENDGIAQAWLPSGPSSFWIDLDGTSARSVKFGVWSDRGPTISSRSVYDFNANSLIDPDDSVFTGAPYAVYRIDPLTGAYGPVTRTSVGRYAVFASANAKRQIVEVTEPNQIVYATTIIPSARLEVHAFIDRNDNRVEDNGEQISDEMGSPSASWGTPPMMNGLYAASSVSPSTVLYYLLNPVRDPRSVVQLLLIRYDYETDQVIYVAAGEASAPIGPGDFLRLVVPMRPLSSR
jgi:hypothetical protein